MKLFFLFLSSAIYLGEAAEDHNPQDEGTLDVHREMDTLAAPELRKNSVVREVETPGPQCPDGFFKSNGSSQCYMFFGDTPRNGSEARTKCAMEKLRLAEPRNPVEVRSYLVEVLDVNGVVHLGAQGDGSAFAWFSTGKQISLKNPWWFPGQPASLSSDQCLLLMSNKYIYERNPKQPFYGAHCHYKQHTLCETPGCPKGFFRTGSSYQCFKIFKDVERSFDEGKAKCESENLRLAEPRDPIAVRSYIVETYGSRWVHLGARGEGTSLSWLHGRNVEKLSGSPFWKSEMPGTRVSSYYCLYLMSHQIQLNEIPDTPYYSDPCSSKRPILCETTK